MDSALDRATDTITPAAGARRSRRYVCQRCLAQVLLRSGDIRRPYFAHSSGLADPDCENYFPSFVPYYGRRTFEGRAVSEGPSVDRQGLCLDMRERQPRLVLKLPPTPDVWDGLITVEAHKVTRSLSCRHLSKPQFISFDLFDGQWSVRSEGLVTQPYLDLITVGRSSLESEMNLFDATHSPGSRIAEGVGIRLGDAIWIVGRSKVLETAPISQLVTLDLRTAVAGWNLYYAELPEHATAAGILALSAWLQRPVRPARAAVWIEHPHPWKRDPQGVATYALDDAPFQIRAAESVDIRIQSRAGKHPAFVFEQASLATWAPPSEGDWELHVNGTWYETFHVTSEVPNSLPAIIVQFGDRPPVDISMAQFELPHLPDAKFLEPQSVTFRWGSPAIWQIVHVNGRPVQPGTDCVLELPLHGTTSVSFGALGKVQLGVEVTPDAKGQATIPRRTLYLARWLASIGVAGSPRGQVRLRIPDELRRIVLFARLSSMTWSISVSAQVQHFQKSLRHLK